MANKTFYNNFAETLIEAIVRPACPIELILIEAKEKIGADDVRFRLKDWQDQSVVFVPNWIIGEELEKKEPELATRVYYDPTEPSRVDCAVGLVARIARIKEEEYKTKSSSILISKLKEGIEEEEIKIERICFNNIDKERIFNDFISRLKQKRDDWQKKAKRWKEYYSSFKGKTTEHASFFSDAFGKEAPWKKEDNAQRKEEQWKQLRTYLFKWRKGNEVNEMLEAFKKTAELYEQLQKQWEDYILVAAKPRCEMAIAVVAFGKFLGVLNFHKEQEFTEHDQHLVRTYAAQLAVALIRQQTELFEAFQRVIRLMGAESNFEVIASKIAEGIRIALQDGLKKDEVFPLLYVANKPITQSDQLTDTEFENRWENAYLKRQRPHPEEEEDLKLWNKENELGPIPIRSNGLGSKIIKKWRQIEEFRKKESLIDSTLFNVAGHVDDPNSVMGSRSAFYHGIKTTGCLPLVFEHRVYGLLYLHCTKRHYFTEAQLRALETSSIQTAIAINSAKLMGDSYEELYGSKILDLLIKDREDELLRKSRSKTV